MRARARYTEVPARFLLDFASPVHSVWPMLKIHPTDSGFVAVSFESQKDAYKATSAEVEEIRNQILFTAAAVIISLENIDATRAMIDVRRLRIAGAFLSASLRDVEHYVPPTAPPESFLS